jgi:hypothetical protein
VRPWLTTTSMGLTRSRSRIPSHLKVLDFAAARYCLQVLDGVGSSIHLEADKELSLHALKGRSEAAVGSFLGRVCSCSGPWAGSAVGGGAAWRWGRLAVLVTVALGSAAALAVPASAPANWNQPVAGSLNVDPTKGAFSPEITSIGGVPYVVWHETDGSKFQIRAAKFNGSAWTAVGSSLNVDATKEAFSPSITTIGGVPYVAWYESDGSLNQIRVASFNGSAWTAVGGSLNVDATKEARDPSITTIGTTLYVAWSESDSAHNQIRVASFNGSAWTAVDDSLNFDPTKGASNPSITSIGATPYVAWSEFDGSKDQIRVASFNGSAWSAVGGSLNFDTGKDAFSPSITSIGTTPYVAWEEDNGSVRQIRVASFNGSAWSAVDGSPNVDPTKFVCAPAITAIGTTPFVAWPERNDTTYQMRVAKFNGSAWSAVGGSLNVDPTKDACDPGDEGIIGIGGVPYLAWNEDSGSAFQIHVKRLEPDILTESATPTATGATLRAQVNDYGVALPVGFELGKTGAFGTQTPLQSSPGSGASTLTTAITGLTPGTQYSYRAFGSDTFRRTSVGATQTFTTLPLPNLTGYKIVPRTFAAAGSGPSAVAGRRKKRKKPGARVSFRLNEPASVLFRVQQRRSGRRGKKGRCVKPTRKNRRARKCKRLVTLRGSFSRTGTAGRNHFRFTGRLRRHKLKPGRYRLVATPTANGTTGRARSVGFRIKGRRHQRRRAHG